MHIYHSAVLPYSQQQLVDLINDVAAYPQFVPYCVESEVFEKTDEVVDASLSVAKGSINQRFRTRNLQTQVSDSVCEIDMNLIEGPFKRFSGGWRVTALNESNSKIELDMNISLNLGLAGMMLKPLIGKVAEKLIRAFSQRAKQLYG